MSRQSLINWQHLDQPRFDRIVEALLCRVHEDDDTEVDVVDGRGGDGGIDIAVRRNGVLDIIYQLKYFPDGFSVSRGKRRQQITRSFEVAMSQSPKRWVLVTPANLTPGEKAFVKGLRKGRAVEVRTIGRAALDSYLARYGDLREYFTRDPLVATLKEVGQESAALTGPADLDNALWGLRRRVSGRSAYWDYAFEVGPERMVKRLYAKHPRAAELEPIQINLVTSDDRLDPATRVRLDEFFSYGADGGRPVVVPPEGIASFEIVGPEWIAEEGAAGQTIEFHSADAGRVAVELRAVSSERAVVSSLVGEASGKGVGAKGFSLGVKLPGGLYLDFRFPHERRAAGELKMRHELAGADAIEARRAIRFIDAMLESHALELWLDGKLVTRLDVAGYTEGSGPSPGNRLLVDDLATIATVRDTGIAVPEHLTAAERAEIRMLRQILDGECVLVREVEGFTATLTGEPDGVMEEFLAQDGRGIRVNSGLRYEIQGRVFDLPDATLFHLNCRVVDREATLSALRAGEGKGRTLAIEAADGMPFRAFLPSAVKDPDLPLVPAPLGVPGIEEHPAIAKLALRPEQ